MNEVSLVYFRAGDNCIERVTVIDNQPQVRKLTVAEAMNTLADLAVLTSQLMNQQKG